MDSLKSLEVLINVQTTAAIVAFGVMSLAAAKLYASTRQKSAAFLSVGLAILFAVRALPAIALFFCPPSYDRSAGISYPEVTGFIMWASLPLETVGCVVSAVSLVAFSAFITKRNAQQGIQPDGPASGGSAS